VVEKILRNSRLWKDIASRPPPVENRAAEREPGYDYGPNAADHEQKKELHLRLPK